MIDYDKPKLKDVYPTVFPNLPKYLSKTLSPIRKMPDERRGEILNKQKMNEQKLPEEKLKADSILNYEYFKNLVLEKINKFNGEMYNLSVKIKSKCMVIYKFNYDLKTCEYYVWNPGRFNSHNLS